MMIEGRSETDFTHEERMSRKLSTILRDYERIG